MEDSVVYDNSMKQVAQALTSTAIITNDSTDANNNTDNNISSSNNHNKSDSSNKNNKKKDGIRVIEYNHPGFPSPIIEAPTNIRSSDSTISIVERLQSNKEMYDQCIRAKKGVYRCNHCDAKFFTLIDFATHMDQVGLARPFMCHDSTCPWHIIGFPNEVNGLDIVSTNMEMIKPSLHVDFLKL